MLAQIDADNSHPRPDDGKIVELEPGSQPLVRVGEIYGRAIKYTRTFGLVEWWMTGAFIMWSGFRLGKSGASTRNRGGVVRCRLRFRLRLDVDWLDQCRQGVSRFQGGG